MEEAWGIGQTQSAANVKTSRKMEISFSDIWDSLSFSKVSAITLLKLDDLSEW